MLIDHDDTIAAISTPLGVGGIGIVRVSGPQAEEIARRIFIPGRALERFESYRMYHGDLRNRQTGEIIDEVLVVLMRRPHSYTGQDVLEIHCHGGPAVMQAILAETLKAGARPAQPGEFTERAYLNGRLDLIQAEAVMDMIQARTELGMKQALSQMKGRLSGRIQALRTMTLDLLALLEAAIDFPEEDTALSRTDLSDRIDRISGHIDALLATYREGKLRRDGMEVVITGRTNVGKSSLLNRLLGEDRAIVTPIAGTTRDFIAEVVNLQGIPVRLTDTAGVRESSDLIESKGIEKVWQKIDRADVILLVLDGSVPLEDEDRQIMERIAGHRIVAVLNKSDLPARLTEDAVRALLPDADLVRISAKKGDGIDSLKASLHDAAAAVTTDDPNQPVIANLRHKEALEKARSLLSVAHDHIVGEGLSPELAAVDLREAFEALGELIGETTAEDVLDRIFSNFCIGK